MDQILRGIVSSDHTESVKKSLIQQLVSKLNGNVPEDQNRSIFEIGTEWMTDENSQFLKETGRLLLTTWAKRQKDVFQKFFTESFLLSFLAERENLSVSFVDYLRTSLDLVQHAPQIFSMYTVIRHRAHIWAEKNLNTDFCAAVGRLLIEYNHCWPVGENLIQFNLSLLRALSKTELPKTSKEEMTACIQNGAVIGALLNKMWTKNQALLFPVLTEIFKIISKVGDSPSVALASVVQYFSTDTIDSATNLAASNPLLSDESLAHSLTRMIKWLSWPGAKKVDQWIIGFLKALASNGKHSILISVALKEVSQVFSRLLFPIVRGSTMVVLSHMLLSFQHSPQAFHEIVVLVPSLVQTLKKENSGSSQTNLQTLAELMHCLMYQHTGFPELYGPVVDCLQDLPKPSEVMIKKWLAQSAWSAQAVNIPLPGFAPKSETGKTGLANLGNTCYMNSVLQALYMLDEFRFMIFGHHSDHNQPVLHHLQQVFAFLSLTQRSAFAPSKFLHVARPPWFAQGTQQDCSEFLKFLLDRLSEEEKSQNNSNDEGSPRTSLVEETFTGKLTVCLCCRRCNNTSCREEVFTDLPLAFPQAGELERRMFSEQLDGLTSDDKQPIEHDEKPVNSTVSSDRSLKGGDITHNVSATGLAQKSVEDSDAVVPSSSHSSTSAESSMPFSAGSSVSSKFREPGVRADAPHISLTEMLKYFFEPEILEGSNQYHCEHCHSLQDAERTVSISKASEFLVLTLKRFAYNVKTQQRSKILQSVSYPTVLRLPRIHLKGGDDKIEREARNSVPDVNDSKNDEIVSHSCFKSKRTKQEHDNVVDSSSSDNSLSLSEETFTADIVYALCSVIVHSGTSSESGHYYCYARSSVHLIGGESDKSSSSRTDDQDTWYLFNDSRVSYSAFSSFADVSKRFPKDTPYVLIYKRVSSFRAAVIPVENSGDSVQDNLVGGEIRQELADMVNRDNLLYLQERERQAMNTAKRKAWSNFHQPPGDDDDDPSKGPPGSCGGGPGFTTPFNRFVF